jgi:hypothetical protein
MSLSTLTIIYGMVLHLASIAVIGALIGVGAVTEAVGLPILSGILGVGIGAGAVLLPSGGSPPTPPLVQTYLPTATTAQTITKLQGG